MCSLCAVIVVVLNASYRSTIGVGMNRMNSKRMKCALSSLFITIAQKALLITIFCQNLVWNSV